MKHPLAPVAEIPDEGAKQISFFGREAMVLKVDGHPEAVMSVCTHLGGPLVCEGEHFRCAWHGASFDRRSKERLSGPAEPGSQLMELPTEVVDGVLTYVYPG